MNNVVPFNYQGQPVRFDSEGWLHATKIAERFGKRLDRWMENADTLNYIQALDEVLTGTESKILDPRNSGYVKTSKARADRGGGTWLHPKLAVAFARWCDAKFSVWCDLHIDALLRGELNEKQQFERACQEYDEAFLRASRGAKEMARFRWRKPLLVEQVEHWRHQLQLTLGLDDQAA